MSRRKPRTTNLRLGAILDELATVRNVGRPQVRTADRDWYRIRDAAGDIAEVWLYDEISWWGISADQFVSELRAITAGTIRLRINCPGGDVFDGLAIYQALISHPARVEVQIDGLAASAASYIAQAGDHVTIGPSAMVMIHDAWGGCMGNAADMRGTADLLDKISDSIADLYAERCGGTADQWRERMLADGGAGTWYTGGEAVEAGLADALVDAGRRRKRCEDGDDQDDDDGGGDEPPMDRSWDLAALRPAPRGPSGSASDLHADPDGPAQTDPDPEPEPDGADDGQNPWEAITTHLTDPWASLTRGLL